MNASNPRGSVFVSTATAEMLYDSEQALQHLATCVAHAMRLVVAGYLLAHPEQADALRPLLADGEAMLELRGAMHGGDMVLEVSGYLPTQDEPVLLHRHAFIERAPEQATH